MVDNLTEFKEFSQHLAKISGKIILEHFRTKINVENKADNSPVTIADKKAEETMREEIIKEFPITEFLVKNLENTMRMQNINGFLTRLTGQKVLFAGQLLSEL